MQLELACHAAVLQAVINSQNSNESCLSFQNLLTRLLSVISVYKKSGKHFIQYLLFLLLIHRTSQIVIHGQNAMHAGGAAEGG